MVRREMPVSLRAKIVLVNQDLRVSTAQLVHRAARIVAAKGLRISAALPFESSPKPGTHAFANWGPDPLSFLTYALKVAVQFTCSALPSREECAKVRGITAQVQVKRC